MACEHVRNEEPLSKTKQKKSIRYSSMDTDYIFSPPCTVKMETKLLKSLNYELGVPELVRKDTRGEDKP